MTIKITVIGDTFYNGYFAKVLYSYNGFHKYVIQNQIVMLLQ